jgi:putative ABC transport system permease protein
MIDKTIMVDSSFLEIFDFELIAGDKSTALDEPKSFVISEETAKNIFGNTDVIGNVLEVSINGEMLEGKVTGVLKDVPNNSHLQFDILVSMSTIYNFNAEFDNEFGSNYMVTYLLLEEGTDIPALEAKFPDFLVKHMNEDINDYYKMYVQQLSDVHLGSVDMDHDYHNWGEFDSRYINVFTLMAFFVMIIAAINFMNLSTARSASRSKEVGLRKSIGARKNQIINQFLGESILLSTLALIIGVILALVFLPFLNQITTRPLSLIEYLQDPIFILSLFGISTVIGIAAGIYPAFVMSSFNPVSVLKGQLSKSYGKTTLQNILVVGQFTVAITLIVSTLIAVQQFHFMKSKDIGFNHEQILLIPLSNEANGNYETLKNEIKTQKGVINATASGQRIGNNFHQWGFKIKTDSSVHDLTVSNVNVDYDYFDVYQIPIKDGRAFSKEYTTDADYGFIVNQALVDELNLEDPLGRSVGHGHYHEDSLGTIVGVTDNFNFNSLHHEVNTLVISIHPNWGYDEMSIKISPENMQETIASIKAVWENIVKDRPFDYSFLDQHFDTLYAADEQMSEIVPIIAILASLIACMGLFGLSTISIEQRIKEIGIRKVMGASIGGLFLMLSKKFTVLILIAFVMSVPISIYMMDSWLTDFAFHIEIGVGVFVITGILSLLIALLTISYRTLVATLQNPAITLKYE